MFLERSSLKGTWRVIKEFIRQNHQMWIGRLGSKPQPWGDLLINVVGQEVDLEDIDHLALVGLGKDMDVGLRNT